MFNYKIPNHLAISPHQTALFNRTSVSSIKYLMALRAYRFVAS